MTRKLTALSAVALSTAALGAAPAVAQAPSSGPLLNCRASAVFASVAGFDRVEPIVANGNPNTANGANPDLAHCADANVGAGSLPTQVGIGPDVLSAKTASAVTDLNPEPAVPKDQRAQAAATVEDLKIPLGSGTVILGVGAANSIASADCADGKARFNGGSQLTSVTLGGTPVSLDQLLEQLTEALSPLGPLVEVKVNEQVRDGNSLTVRALHVKVLRDAGSAPLLDVIVAESRVVAPEGVCVNGGTNGNGGDGLDKACPSGSTLDRPSGFCVIAGKGVNGQNLVIGRPFQGPSGGSVIALSDARRDPRYRNSPCVKANGSPRYVIVGTNGKDRITGTNQRDRILGMGGSDSLSGGRGADCLDGGAGRDALSGSVGSDKLYGMSGNDSLNGGSQSDRLSGGSGNDSINAAYGSDRIYGGPGRDAINVATAGRKARVHCGSGRDTVRFNNEEHRQVARDCEVRAGLPDSLRKRRR